MKSDRPRRRRDTFDVAHVLNVDFLCTRCGGSEVSWAEAAVRTVNEQRRVFVESEKRARSAIAWFLHDTVQGSLVAISLQLRAVRSETEDPIRGRLGSILDALEEMRAVDVRWR